MPAQQVTVIESATASVEDVARKTTALALQFNYEGDLSVGALEDGIRFYQQRTVESMLELGKRLILLKEITPRGEFEKRVELLNFSPRMAQKFMSAVIKISKTNSNTLLSKVGNQTKLLELVTLDDDEIEILSNGGSIGDITMDSIELMSTRELKQKVRELKADTEAKDLIIRSKDEKLNKLDTELTKAQSPVAIKKREETEEQQLSKAVLDEIKAAGIEMYTNTMRFINRANTALETIDEHRLFAIQERVTQEIIAAFQHIAQASTDLGVQVDFEEMVSPNWDLGNDTGIEEPQVIYEHQGLEG